MLTKEEKQAMAERLRAWEGYPKTTDEISDPEIEKAAEE